MKSNMHKKKNTKPVGDYGENANFKLRILPDSVNIGKVREQVYNSCEKAGVDPEDVQDICLAVVEAVTNAIRHSECRKLSISVAINKDYVIAEVADDGKGFPFKDSHCEFPDIDSQSGRGLPIMFNLSDQLSVSSEIGNGTTITMIKNLAKRNSHHR
ncbi:MAG: ATP-binding protein [Rubrobacteridae bacterium]|nr:ATP-binding protein [Rubrobacteridae bacterium]